MSASGHSIQLYNDKFGNPAEVIELREILTPAPSADEIVARVILTPVHPSVQAAYYGKYPGSKPGVQGNEAVAEITAVGANLADKFKVGQKIIPAGAGGTYSEHIVLKQAQVLTVVPEGLADDQAAQFIVNGLTAYAFTEIAKKTAPTDFILHTAAGSTLGRILIQLAKVKKLNLINVVRRKEQVEELKKAGAQHVVVFDGTNQVEASEAVKAIVGANGKVKFAFDAVGSTTTEWVWSVLGYTGRVYVYGALAADGKLTVGTAHGIAKSLELRIFMLRTWIEKYSTTKLPAAIKDFMILLITKQVVIPVENTYTFAEYKTALDHAFKSGNAGKVLLKPR